MVENHYELQILRVDLLVMTNAHLCLFFSKCEMKNVEFELNYPLFVVIFNIPLETFDVLEHTQ